MTIKYFYQLLLIAMFGIITSCKDKNGHALPLLTDPEGAEKTIRHFGFKPIDVGGFCLWCHSSGDFYATNFKAVALDGDTVRGVVTRGFLFKASTIRLKN